MRQKYLHGVGGIPRHSTKPPQWNTIDSDNANRAAQSHLITLCGGRGGCASCLHWSAVKRERWRGVVLNARGTANSGHRLRGSRQNKDHAKPTVRTNSTRRVLARGARRNVARYNARGSPASVAKVFTSACSRVHACRDKA